jgi:hypothetical protein
MVIGRLGQLCASAGPVNASVRASEPATASPFAFHPKESIVNLRTRLLSMAHSPAPEFAGYGQNSHNPTAS